MRAYWPLLLTTLSFSTSRAVADDKAKFKTYFESFLKQQQEVLPKNESIKPKELSNLRKQVWAEWKAANAQCNDWKLPKLDSLGVASSSWVLPDSLEPSATLPFYYGCKGNKADEGYPLFLYLHGSGSKQYEWSTGLALAKWFNDGPSAYFIPQIPNEGEWYRWWQKSKQFAWERLLMLALLADEINPNRLYVFGISEGGYGSQRLASYYADYWAAAGPMAGGEPLKNAPVENLYNIGFSFLTGANDRGFYRNTLTQYTKEALDSLERIYPSAYQHRIELIPNKQHAIDYRTTTPWLSKFTRNAHPHHYIWEDFEMDGAHRKGFYNLKVLQHPTQSERARYEVNISNNVVDIVVGSVNYTTTEKDVVYGIEMKFKRTYNQTTGGFFLLFLDEHLVDLKTPVTVKVNGRVLYNKKLKLNTNNLLQSVTTFYDPERLYPAAVRIDY